MLLQDCMAVKFSDDFLSNTLASHVFKICKITKKRIMTK